MEKGKQIVKNSSEWSRRKITMASILIIAIIGGFIAYIILSTLPPALPPDGGIGCQRSSTATNHTITIISVPLLNSISDYSVTTHNASGTTLVDHTSLSIFETGTYVNGLNFTDRNHDGKLGAGDYFSLDKAIFPTGSEFILYAYDTYNVIMSIEIH